MSGIISGLLEDTAAIDISDNLECVSTANLLVTGIDDTGRFGPVFSDLTCNLDHVECRRYIRYRMMDKPKFYSELFVPVVTAYPDRSGGEFLLPTLVIRVKNFYSWINLPEYVQVHMLECREQAVRHRAQFLPDCDAIGVMAIDNFCDRFYRELCDALYRIGAYEPDDSCDYRNCLYLYGGYLSATDTNWKSPWE